MALQTRSAHESILCVYDQAENNKSHFVRFPITSSILNRSRSTCVMDGRLMQSVWQTGRQADRQEWVSKWLSRSCHLAGWDRRYMKKLYLTWMVIKTWAQMSHFSEVEMTQHHCAVVFYLFSITAFREMCDFVEMLWDLMIVMDNIFI